MKWNIARAKMNFSEMIHETESEPQFIFNRDKMVAVIITPQQYDSLKIYNENKKRQTLENVFKNLRDICAEEGYRLISPERKDRQTEW